MKSRTVFSLLALLCWFAPVLAAAEPLDVSLVQLIANPKDYDGKIVRVIGFVKLEFEGNAIYLHQDDYKYGISKNGLWIDVTEEIRKRSTEFDQKYVMLEGMFNAKWKGHMGHWSGSIQKISALKLWIERNTKPH